MVFFSIRLTEFSHFRINFGGMGKKKKKKGNILLADSWILHIQNCILQRQNKKNFREDETWETSHKYYLSVNVPPCEHYN